MFQDKNDTEFVFVDVHITYKHHKIHMFEKQKKILKTINGTYYRQSL